MKRKNEEEDVQHKKIISENEIKALRKGLLKKLEQLKFSFWQILIIKILFLAWQNKFNIIKIFYKQNFIIIITNFFLFFKKQ